MIHVGRFSRRFYGGIVYDVTIPGTLLQACVGNENDTSAARAGDVEFRGRKGEWKSGSGARHPIGQHGEACGACGMRKSVMCINVQRLAGRLRGGGGEREGKLCLRNGKNRRRCKVTNDMNERWMTRAMGSPCSKTPSNSIPSVVLEWAVY